MKIVPENFKLKVDQHLKLFRGYEQQDAHEFMCSLVEQMDKEISTTEEEEMIKIFPGKKEVRRKCTENAMKAVTQMKTRSQACT